ncbi:MAG TPA: hypothetical protein VG965_00040 [Patescibacteria group bacterium]|nr:hypothetical protein [Patescibacteria group bacterium]
MVELNDNYHPEREFPVSRAVLVLFPDSRTTGNFHGQDGYVPYMANSFRNSTDRVLKRYRSQGYKTIGLTYQDTGDENFSYLYPREAFDELLIWSMSFADLVGSGKDFHKSYNESFPEFLEKLNLADGADVVVGGYHAADCVPNFSNWLRSENHNPRIDLRLTDELPFLLISHHFRNYLRQGLLMEHNSENRAIWEWKKATVG